MKKLLLFCCLITSVTAFGQTLDGTWKIHVVVEDTNLIMVTEKHGEEMLQDYLDRRLAESAIRLWEGYEAYHWDSIKTTYKERYKYKYDTATIKRGSNTCVWELQYYHHKKTGLLEPTFKGFIEYIKKRKEKK